MGDLPKAWGVLYAAPNPDGSKKLCANCMFFVPDQEMCVIQKQTVIVTPGMVCGYHVFGTGGVALDPVDAKLSGLEDVSDLDGTVCGECKFFERRGRGSGVCHGVAKVNGVPPQPVQEMGCCARWERA